MLNKTPKNIQKIIILFDRAKVEYNLFKCEHIFDGENKNLDVLLRRKTDFNLACKILCENGFMVNLPEKVEKYKKMYYKWNGKVITRIHLHKEVAWHGIIALNKEKVFARAKEKVPSNEDSILIHTAHTLFENYKIRNRERKYLPPYFNKLNFRYMIKHSKVYGWNEELVIFLKMFRDRKKLSKKVILNAHIKNFLKKPNNVLNFLLSGMKGIKRKLSPRKKGSLVALVGVNGVGKTTLAKELREKLKELKINNEYYYFGWKPFSPLAKIISKISRNKKTFKKVTSDYFIKKEKFSLFQEGLFFYNYIDYILRYYFLLYPKLKKGKSIVVDRYIYDLYGQYPYSSRSMVIKSLIKLFPKPDFTFLLDASIVALLTRGKEGEIREIKTVDCLSGQRSRYHYLSKWLKFGIINTECKMMGNIDLIVEKIWRKIIVKPNLPKLCKNLS